MLNVIIGMICLGSPHCFYHRISQNFTDFVVETREAERQRENVEMGSFTMFVVTQVGQLSQLSGHSHSRSHFPKSEIK